MILPHNSTGFLTFSARFFPIPILPLIHIRKTLVATVCWVIPCLHWVIPPLFLDLFLQLSTFALDIFTFAQPLDIFTDQRRREGVSCFSVFLPFFVCWVLQIPVIILTRLPQRCNFFSSLHASSHHGPARQYELHEENFCLGLDMPLPTPLGCSS